MIKSLAAWVRDRLPHAVRYHIGRIGRYFAPRPLAAVEQVRFPSVEGALDCLRSHGFNPRFAIDVGAYHGEWTLMLRKYFPTCAVLMIEAQEQKRCTLDAICAGSNPPIDCRIAVLGSESGRRVQFVEMETGSSVYEEQSAYDRQVTDKDTVILDDLLGTESRIVDLIKLDVQGYELEVLRGASRSLEQAQVVLTEASLVPINRGAPLVAEVIRFMDERGFRLVDFCSQIRRKDGVLWQTDLLFVRVTSGFLPDNRLTATNWG